MERHDLNGYCGGAARYKAVQNYQQFLETNAGEEFKKGYEKSRAFFQKALEETVGREVADCIQNISAFDLIDFGTPLVTHTQRNYLSEEDLYNGSYASGYDEDGNLYAEWEAVDKYIPLISYDVLKNNDPEKAGMKIFNELVRVNVTERVLTGSAYEKAYKELEYEMLSAKEKRHLQLENAFIDGYNTAKINFDSKLDKLDKTIISTANVDDILDYFYPNKKDIFKKYFKEISNPYKFLKGKTHKTNSGPIYFSDDETIESAYERGIAGFESDASDAIRRYDDYYKGGKFKDELVGPDEIICGMNFDREYAEGLLETSIKETLSKNIKEEKVNNIIGNIKLCNEKHDEIPQENKKVQKM